MVAFNFTQFIDKVASGEKRMTIRKTARAKPGDSIQLYTDQRKKTCRKLRDDAVCVKVFEVEILETGVIMDDEVVREIGLERDMPWETSEAFAQMDGFDSGLKMRMFFKETYGLPFKGYAHVWNFPA